MRKPLAAALPLALLLAACSGTVQRIPADPAPPSAQVRIAYRTVELSEVTLPTYAAAEEIFLQGADGVLTSSSDLLWADDPKRAVTLGLVRALNQITGAQVAPAPWLYESLPDARIEVQVEDMVADLRSARFRLSGQYFVAAAPGIGRDRARSFDLTVPLTAEPTTATIAAARSRAVADLAVTIAREGLR